MINGKYERSKLKEKKYDDREDTNIRNVAFEKDVYFDKVIFCILIILIGVLVGTTVLLFKDRSDKDIKLNEHITKIVNTGEEILIVDNGNIKEHVNSDSFKEKDSYVKENISSIELMSLKNNHDSSIHYNVKYQILNNNSTNNLVSSGLGDVLVRFSYSYDGENWEYVNNAIRTQESVIKPLMGKYFDVSGLVDKLKVTSNNVLDAKDGEKKKIYWKSETIFQNKNNNNINNNYEAKFIIEYVDNNL